MPKLSQLSRSIENKVAIITGAASGMGRATSYLFADEGAVVAAVDINEEGLKETCANIEAAGGKVKGYTVNLAEKAQIDEMVESVAKEFGTIDILVNNAGVTTFAPIGDDNYEDAWDLTLNINLKAYTRTIRAALPYLTKNNDGRIINIASTEGMGATALISPYTASKHGVIGLSQALAVELGPVGVTVNTICPGPINTGMTAFIDDENKTKFARRRVPMKRYGNPEEVAHGILNFALPGSSFMTGSTLLVDGGLRAQNT